MRIAIDIDSTLHHYWDVLSESARRRFGVQLPYDRQFTWGITGLRDEQLAVCIADSHSDAAIEAAQPYPHAVETVNAWHAAGHFVHITSHRADHSRAATQRWLDAIGLRHDDLYCSFDKIRRCTEIAIDVLVDDSPVNIVRALEFGIVPATILHPWNMDVVEDEGVIAAADWQDLARRLEPLLAAPQPA